MTLPGHEKQEKTYREETSHIGKGLHTGQPPCGEAGGHRTARTADRFPEGPSQVKEGIQSKATQT